MASPETASLFAPRYQRDVAWQTIKAKAERIVKNFPRGEVTFAAAVDRVLTDEPSLYEQYRAAMTDDAA